MSGVMQSTGRGRKHRCAACGAAFYDLERDLTACPKCDTPYAAEAQMPRGEPARKRQSWGRSARRAEPEADTDAAGGAASEDQGDVPILDAVDDAEEAEDVSEATEDGDPDDPQERKAPSENQA